MVATGDGHMLVQGFELGTAHKYRRIDLPIEFDTAYYAASYFNNKHNLLELTIFIRKSLSWIGTVSF